MSIKHSTRNNSFSDEMLLCEDLTLNILPGGSTHKLPLELSKLCVSLVTCDICDLEFDNADQLNIHKIEHDIPKVSSNYPAQECNEVGLNKVQKEDVTKEGEKKGVIKVGEKKKEEYVEIIEIDGLDKNEVSKEGEREEDVLKEEDKNKEEDVERN